MTSIAIAYNKLGIAIAADSAATVNLGNGSPKIFDANKMFKVSNTVGIGIYQNPNLGNIPLEVTINEYKRNLHEFQKLEEYIYDFIKYLEETKFLEEKSIEQEMLFYINKIGGELREFIAEETSKEITPVTEEMVEKYSKIFFKRDFFHKKLNGNNENIIEYGNEGDIKILKKCIETDKEQLKNILVKNDEKILLKFVDDLFFGFENYINQFNFCDDFTGLIFVGYGLGEVLPKLFHLEIRGKYNGKIYFNSIEEDNKKNPIESGIFGYADAEVITSTVCGYSPKFSNMILNLQNNLLLEMGKKIKKEYKIDIGNNIEEMQVKVSSAVENFRINEVLSFVKAVNSLSLDELSNVVETLVNVTSFKKRISTNLETVGGATDVAVISRFDGFKWIKKKSYYKQELNLN